MRFLFTCGGTAGHINPAVGVAGRLKKLIPEAEILFIGAEGMMETELVPREGYEIRTVEISNLSRSLSLDGLRHNLHTARSVVRSRQAARAILRDFHPDVVIGTGGYVCYPVIAAAHSLGIPTLLHESNAVPGLTTKLLSHTADCIMVEDRKPTVREIGNRFGVCKSTAQNYVGYIRRRRVCVQLEKFNAGYEKAARLGNDISCGSPCYEEQNIDEYLRLPSSVFGK